MSVCFIQLYILQVINRYRETGIFPRLNYPEPVVKIVVPWNACLRWMINYTFVANYTHRFFPDRFPIRKQTVLQWTGC